MSEGPREEQQMKPESWEAVLQQAARDSYWGEITLCYRAGVVTLVRKSETITITDKGEPCHGQSTRKSQ
jgi:hypothetical protein